MTEGGQTILYINKYYEKNLTTSVVTTNYYLGDRLVAERQGSTLQYIHQDALTGTSVTTSSTGTSTGSIKYFSFGQTRSGSVPTDQKFTGQRLDSTGLYYYGARYYDADIGRFIGPDTIVPSPANPQSLNRYSYCLNNPLKYTDPSGHYVAWVYDANYDDTITAWNTYKELYPEIAADMENSDELFTIGGGDAGGGLGLTSKLTKIGLQNDGSYNFNSGTRITLDYDKIKPENNGNNAVVWTLSHEVVHAIGISVFGYQQMGTLWEETLAFRFQYETGQKLGYDPSFSQNSIPRFFNSAVQRTNYVLHKTLVVNISVEITSETISQLATAFQDTSYLDDYRMENGKVSAWPQSSSYRSKMVDYFSGYITNY